MKLVWWIIDNWWWILIIEIVGTFFFSVKTEMIDIK